MIRFDVSNLHADRVCWILRGDGAHGPPTGYTVDVVRRDEEQSGIAVLETSAPRDVVEAAMRRSAEVDDQATAIGWR